ncbi:hypothetical protein Q7560_06520 [Glaesserella parasuis]|uniref:hypothetical protein n=1 Tax=Glaesserella parasuis TaxID=738 RepID=UPI000991E2AE|nr:hypothetical protein [Glaesserella parasuis]MCT8557380.1 hypothetical protein [Glaesserella parasuis]MCT8742093.1 hypothetical protein [Glaesserella parasuis]MCT8744739.1 hypothetical protein [Glaesserella parasuis]MCT8761188.1 hypothetical protein [Glaesserella parasuis]MCT8767576.1 hypothetical protein [Glaesserella parasuis]
MSEHLFILYGAANTGKTTSFNELFEKICHNFLANLIYFERNENLIDFIAVFQNSDITVGLYSAGDGEIQIRHNLYQLNNHNCDYILGTSRTRGKGVGVLNKYAELFHDTNESIKWYKKEDATDEDNSNIVKQLFKEFQKLLK